MPLGLYISVPFCRTKCSYCNFASSQLIRIFDAVRGKFVLSADAEITVECAPGTLSSEMIETLLRCGVNRVSLGVQSFVDQEVRSVGRLHTRATVLEEIGRLRAAGIGNINIDLIAGLPHQTQSSWEYSLSETVATGAPHVSVYMLEVDEDSRLGRELIAGGTRYHAHFVPDEDAMADFYQQAYETLNEAGIAQYEISNFARAGAESRHNLKYWTRQPYLGFGVDAHSMLRRPSGAKAQDQSGAYGTAKAMPFHRYSLDISSEAVRFSTSDSLDAYMNRSPLTVTPVSKKSALEESFFLGLRLNRGVDMERIRDKFEEKESAPCESAIGECVAEGLLERQGIMIRLTARGRLLSNEVFARFLTEGTEVGTGHVNPR
jgi:oxygen-independent coproporphyrinogen-3 oxidase